MGERRDRVTRTGLFDHNKKVDAKQKCEGCFTTLKNPKKYAVIGRTETLSGRWSIIKRCTRCKTDNIPEMK